MQALNYKPTGFWLMDDPAPFQDYSGYNRSGTLTGTERRSVALTSDTLFSQVLNNTITATFPTPGIYEAGRESNPFSLSATVYPSNDSASYALLTNSQQQILSNQDRYDGLTIDGTKISFSTKYLTTGEAKTTYDIQMVQKVDVVGVHTQSKNSLYVNGSLVSEVDITPEQQLDTYDAPNANLYSGKTLSSQNILLNAVATYSRALQTEEVASLYRSNNRRPQGSVAKMYGGEDVPVSTLARPLFLDTGWFTEEDWTSATLTSVVVEDNQLSASMANGLTVEGSWIDSVDLYAGQDPVNINSVNMWWQGVNETVEASVDGDTWVPVEKGQNISVIPTGFDPTDKALYIRVSFPEGKEEAFVDSMQVNGYLSNTAMSNNRLLTYTNPAVPFDEHPPALLRDDWGVRLSGSGSITMSQDTSDVKTNPVTLEVWVKKLPGAAMNRTFSAQAIWMNGLPGAANAPATGEWALMHYVATGGTPFAGNVSFGADIQVGSFAVYDRILTNAEVAAIYANYTGYSKVRYDGTGTISVSEPASPALVYAHDWSIQSS